MFNENSGLVKVMVRLVEGEDKTFTINSVPNVANLKEVVKSVIAKNKKGSK